MQARHFVKRLRQLCQHQNAPAMYQRELAVLREELFQIAEQEETPAPPERYPAWLDFASRYAAALEHSHLSAHYFEFRPPVLERLGGLYDRLTAFVQENPVREEALESFVRREVEAGRVIRSRPVDRACWRAPFVPGTRLYYIQCVLQLDAPQPSRGVHAPLDDVLLLRRHGGSQVQFAVRPGVPTQPEPYDTAVLTLWVEVATDDPAAKRVRFGTGYIGQNFPFEEERVLKVLADEESPLAYQLPILKDFLQRCEDNQPLFALLPPSAL